MRRRTVLVWISLTIAGLFSRPFVAAQDKPETKETETKKAATPRELALESFDAFKNQKLDTFAADFHPDELKRFKEFAAKLMAAEIKDKGRAGLELTALREFFDPLDSVDAVNAAEPAKVLESFMKNMLVQIPGYKELLADAKLEIMGELPEGDKVHVITRTFLPRPSPVTCQKHEGQWRLMLNPELSQMVFNFEKLEHFRKAKIVEDIPQGKIERVDVIGHVADGDDLAQVLCRVHMKVGDFAFPVFGCYPVRDTDAAWKHLGDKDKTELVKALREKWGG